MTAENMQMNEMGCVCVCVGVSVCKEGRKEGKKERKKDVKSVWFSQLTKKCVFFICLHTLNVMLYICCLKCFLCLFIKYRSFYRFIVGVLLIVHEFVTGQSPNTHTVKNVGFHQLFPFLE